MGKHDRGYIDRAVALETAMDLLEDGEDNTGVCLVCGETQYGCEPDARKYECESCGAHEVYGAEEILVMFA